MPKMKETKPLFIYQFFTKPDIFNGPDSYEPDNRELVLKGAENWGIHPPPKVRISLCPLLNYCIIHPLLQNAISTYPSPSKTKFSTKF